MIHTTHLFLSLLGAIIYPREEGGWFHHHAVLHPPSDAPGFLFPPRYVASPNLTAAQLFPLAFLFLLPLSVSRCPPIPFVYAGSSRFRSTNQIRSYGGDGVCVCVCMITFHLFRNTRGYGHQRPQHHQGSCGHVRRCRRSIGPIGASRPRPFFRAHALSRWGWPL